MELSARVLHTSYKPLFLTLHCKYYEYAVASNTMLELLVWIFIYMLISFNNRSICIQPSKHTMYTQCIHTRVDDQYSSHALPTFFHWFITHTQMEKQSWSPYQYSRTKWNGIFCEMKNSNSNNNLYCHLPHWFLCSLLCYVFCVLFWFSLPIVGHAILIAGTAKVKP